MRLGRISTISLLSIAAAYAVGFVGCGGDSSGGNGKSTGTGIITGTGTTTSTTIVITGVGGSGGGTGTGGAGGSGGDVIISEDAACVADARAGEQIPIDLFFMVDKSGSMTCPVGPEGLTCEDTQNPPPAVNRWTSIKEALVAFANSPDASGLGVGMGFFPLMDGSNRLLCTPQDYATPVAPIAALPGSAAAFQAAIDAQMPNGNTPTVPALSGAVQYALSYAQTHPGRTVAIVFATDGVPTQCAQNNNSIPGAVSVAQAAAMGPPSIKTFVLGVGPRLSSLNQIAAAGGTNAAHLVESGGSADLLKALNEIRKGTLTCDYKIPVIPGKLLDPKLVNIKTRVGALPGGMEQVISKVDSAAQCGPTQGGWYFDNNAAPTKITLCPATCDPLLKTPGSGLNVLFGCKGVVTPPK